MTALPGNLAAHDLGWLPPDEQDALAHARRNAGADTFIDQWIRDQRAVRGGSDSAG